MAEARERTRLGLVDQSDFDEVRRGRAATEVLVELLAKRPATEDIVFTHGDYCLPNVFVSPLGFIDCGRAGRADRYQDLALAARSVAYNLGPEWVVALWEAHGHDTPDEEKLAFYTLLDEFF
jgi:aminoglycoside phosphotransferase